MWGYLKHFEDAKTMSLLVGDKKLFKKYNEDWSEIMEKKSIITQFLMTNILGAK